MSPHLARFFESGEFLVALAKALGPYLAAASGARPAVGPAGTPTATLLESDPVPKYTIKPAPAADAVSHEISVTINGEAAPLLSIAAGSTAVLEVPHLASVVLTQVNVSAEGLKGEPSKDPLTFAAPAPAPVPPAAAGTPTAELIAE